MEGRSPTHDPSGLFRLRVRRDIMRPCCAAKSAGACPTAPEAGSRSSLSSPTTTTRPKSQRTARPAPKSTSTRSHASATTPERSSNRSRALTEVTAQKPPCCGSSPAQVSPLARVHRWARRGGWRRLDATALKAPEERGDWRQVAPARPRLLPGGRRREGRSADL
jgi:hypothetical protein